MSLGSTSALPSCQPAAAVPPPCTPCIFGAATSLHSFPYQVETVTVEVIPLVTPLRNGSLETSYLTTTLTESFSGGQLPGTQITDPGATTWTLSDSLVLTSPTTYVQYTDFYGAPGTAAPVTKTDSAGAASSCAQWSNVKAIPFPPNADLAAFVVPLAANASVDYTFYSQNLVPIPILDYMEGLSWVTLTMGQDDLAVCSASYRPTPRIPTMPTICTTESISTITTCPSTTRLNATTCVTTTTQTTVVVTLGLPTGPNIVPNMTTTGPPRPSTVPEPPTYSSPPSPATSPKTTPAQPVYASTGWNIASSPVSHETVHVLTTITKDPSFVISDGSGSGSDVNDPTGSSVPVAQQTSSPQSSQNSAPSIPLQTPGSGGQPLVQSDQQAPPSSPSSTQTKIIVGTQTVLPGGAVSDGGTTFSFASTGSIVFVNGQPTSISGPVMTIGTEVISVVQTADVTTGEPELVGGTQTVSPGQAITIAGTTLSLPSTPQGMVYVNGEPTRVPGSVLTVGGTPFTLTSQGPTVVATINGLAGGGQIILPGEVVTTDGATISVPNSAGTVFVDGRPTVISGSVITVGTDVFSVITTVVTTTSLITPTPNPGNGGAVFRATPTPVTSKKSSADRTVTGEPAFVYSACVMTLFAMTALFL